MLCCCLSVLTQCVRCLETAPSGLVRGKLAGIITGCGWPSDGRQVFLACAAVKRLSRRTTLVGVWARLPFLTEAACTTAYSITSAISAAVKMKRRCCVILGSSPLRYRACDLLWIKVQFLLKWKLSWLTLSERHRHLFLQCVYYFCSLAFHVCGWEGSQIPDLTFLCEVCMLLLHPKKHSELLPRNLKAPCRRHLPRWMMHNNKHHVQWILLSVSIRLVNNRFYKCIWFSKMGYQVNIIVLVIFTQFFSKMFYW